ncbi:DUF4870 domain-containing protein [Candidatus Gracilibacteria bacterium]|nr:DUF4870 domain-containing protein [Candidatus Gracilibacteria bacterium]MCF7819761.1 DUF4870 domain-containing protein [Candidatus Gracilibacteria bacterium]
MPEEENNTGVGEKLKEEAKKVVPPKDEKSLASKGEKTLSAIGYISFFCILPLVLKPDSEFAQFHGKQGLVITILFLLLSWIGWFSAFMGFVILILHVVLVLLAIINALQGRKWKIPFISQASEKLDFNE